MKQKEQEVLNMVKEAIEKDLYIKAEYIPSKNIYTYNKFGDGKRIAIRFDNNKLRMITLKEDNLDNPNVDNFIFSLVTDKETIEMLDKEVMLWKIEGEK